eukprot:1161221-Pelagomonas_calceolata.AAC.3
MALAACNKQITRELKNQDSLQSRKYTHIVARRLLHVVLFVIFIGTNVLLFSSQLMGDLVCAGVSSHMLKSVEQAGTEEHQTVAYFTCAFSPLRCLHPVQAEGDQELIHPSRCTTNDHHAAFICLTHTGNGCEREAPGAHLPSAGLANC